MVGLVGPVVLVVVAGVSGRAVMGVMVGRAVMV